MTQDEIIKMAKQCSFTKHWEFEKCLVCNPESLYHFAKLVAAKEQEAIIDLVAFYGGSVDLEAAIRARGEPTLRGNT
jgi:hypothetical protein